MKALLLFNPEHELALANNDCHYVPPENIRHMAADLSLLPYWIANDGDLVWVKKPEEIKAFLHSLPLKSTAACCIPWGEAQPACRIQPWGWDVSVVEQLKKAGIEKELLPSPEQLQTLRKLSQRKEASALLQRWRTVHPTASYGGEAFTATTLEELHAILSTHSSVLLKAPISGSGKGLRFVEQKLDVSQSRWCQGLFRRYGYVMVEPRYHKLLDFALEFSVSADGEATFTGYSLFATDSYGCYTHNFLATDAVLETKLAEQVPLSAIQTLRDKWGEYLTQWLDSRYEGPLGIDLMVVQDTATSHCWIHPCVEVNLRMTMGAYAHQLYQRWLPAGQTGVFAIHYEKSADQLAAFATSMMNQHPIETTAGHISNGYYPLTPIGANTHYHAYLLADAVK